MNRFDFAVWTLGGVVFLYLMAWTGMRLMRWAKKGSKGTALLGLGMGLSAALLDANPQPPKEIQIEEVVDQIHGKKSSDSAGPDK